MRHLPIACCIAVAALLCIPEGFAMRDMDFFEQYDLGELSYIGLNQRECGFGKYNSAIVVDPQGFPHRVRRGEYMGRDFGVVTQISATYMELKELYKDHDGEWAVRTVAMPLTKNRYWRAGWRYEQDRALYSLGQSNEGQKLRDRLVLCRQLYGENAERLACFDAAVGTLF